MRSRVQIAGVAQRHVRAHVNGRQLLAGQQHARLGGAAQLRDVFGVPGERAARKRDRLLIQRRRDHGIRLPHHAHPGGDSDVLHRGHAAARIQAAEGEIFDAAQSGGIAQQRRCEFEAGDAPRHLENPRIAHHDPVGQRRHLRVGQRLEHNLRADPGGVAHGERDGGKLVYGVGHVKKSATWIRACGAPNPPDLVATRASIEGAAGEITPRYAGNDFVLELDAAHTERAAHQRRRVSAREHQRGGGARRVSDQLAHAFQRCLSHRQVENHVLAAAERQQVALLFDGDGVIGADAEEHGRGRPGGRPRTGGSAPRQCAGQRGSQAGRTGPEDTPPRSKARSRNRVQVAVARGIHGNEAGAGLDGRVNRRRLHVHAGFQTQARGKIDGLRGCHPQITPFDGSAHGRKCGRNHGRVATERGERGGDLRPHIAAQSGIDLLEQDARLSHRKPSGQVVHDWAKLGRAQMAALGADGQHAGFFAVGIQANVGPVPAPRKVHGGVTGAGEIVGDQQALEVRGWRHAAYYGIWEPV